MLLCYCDVTMLLWCHYGTMMLLCMMLPCYYDVTMLSWCYYVIMMLLCYCDVTMLLWCYYAVWCKMIVYLRILICSIKGMPHNGYHCMHIVKVLRHFGWQLHLLWNIIASDFGLLKSHVWCCHIGSIGDSQHFVDHRIDISQAPSVIHAYLETS